MKAVLISIQTKWCELIASGKKTVEVRKAKPRLETPFKCYIYCTNSKPILGRCLNDNSLKETPIGDFDNYNRDTLFMANSKVIGEFVCDKIFTIRYRCGSYRCEGMTVRENDRVAAASKLSLFDMRNYLSCNGGYGWHISDLVIYDKPKELGEFRSYNVSTYIDEEFGLPMPTHEIKRPPQSYMYVEGLR